MLGAARAQPGVPELSHSLTPVEPSVPAPGFALPDMDGEVHRLADYRGRVVLVNFWATWCPPCRKEMPSLERLHQALVDEGLTVLAVNQWESPDLVFEYMGQIEVFPSFPILFDRSSELAQAYGVKGLPTSVVVDPQGAIVYRAIGGREFDHPQIQARIRELLEE